MVGTSAKTKSLHARGFTLVELLVVISILTVLLAILIPAISGARTSAKSALCINNMRQIAQAHLIVAAENGGHFRQGHDSSASDGFQDWSMSLASKNGPLKATEMLRQTGGTFDSPPPVLRCPLRTNFEVNRVNIWNWRLRVTYVSHFYTTGYSSRVHMSQVPPSRALLFEKADFWTFGGDEQTNIYFALNRPRELFDTQYLPMRHPGESQNVAFVDGTVRRVTLDQFTRAYTPVAEGGLGGGIGTRYYYNQSGAVPARKPFWIDLLQ